MHPSGRHVFVSHARSDQLVVARLRARIQSCGIATWQDLELDYDGRTEHILGEAIASSLLFVAVITPASIQRPWVGWEVSRALRQAGLPIVPACSDALPGRIPEPFVQLLSRVPAVSLDAAAAVVVDVCGALAPG
jgi:hypothetical protein